MAKVSVVISIAWVRTRGGYRNLHGFGLPSGCHENFGSLVARPTPHVRAPTSTPTLTTPSTFGASLLSFQRKQLKIKLAWTMQTSSEITNIIGFVDS